MTTLEMRAALKRRRDEEERNGTVSLEIRRLERTLEALASATAARRKVVQLIAYRRLT